MWDPFFLKFCQQNKQNKQSIHAGLFERTSACCKADWQCHIGSRAKWKSVAAAIFTDQPLPSLIGSPAIPCVAASVPLPTYYIVIGQFNHKLLLPYFMSGGPPIDPMKHIGLDCYTNATVEPLSLHFAWPLTWFCSIEQLELRSVLPGFMGLLSTSHSKWHSLTYPSERMGALRPSLVYSAPKQTPFRSKCSHLKKKRSRDLRMKSLMKMTKPYKTIQNQQICHTSSHQASAADTCKSFVTKSANRGMSRSCVFGSWVWNEIRQGGSQYTFAFLWHSLSFTQWLNG